MQHMMCMALPAFQVLIFVIPFLQIDNLSSYR